MIEAPAWVSPVLTLFVSLLLPQLIASVNVVSTKRWLRLIVAYGTSALLGVATALIAGDFTTDMWQNITIAITATQVAYKLYWQPKWTAPQGVSYDPPQGGETPA